MGSEGIGHGQALLLARSLRAFCLLRRASCSALHMVPVTASRDRQSSPGRSQALVTTNRGRELTFSQGLWTSHLKSPLLGLLWRSGGYDYALPLQGARV